jgi:hypothetical protein
MPHLSAPLGPDSLFVIACPVCLGQVAATGSLCGSHACCPLCACLFQVPYPAVTRPHDQPVTAPLDQPPAGIAEDWTRVIRQLARPPQDPAPQPIPELSAEFELPAGMTDPAETAEDPDARPAQPGVDGLPIVGGTPLDPSAMELVFTEPVRTVRHGTTVIEIRRLTPEERRARRFRRNVLMIVVGVSILLAIVLVFGVPKKP